MLVPSVLSNSLSGTLGMPFATSHPTATSVELQLDDGQEATRTFALVVKLSGRKLEVKFRPGRWAGELVHAMGQADPEAKRMWSDLIARCTTGGGGRVAMLVNGAPVDPATPEAWPANWQMLDVSFERPRVALDAYDREGMGLEPPEIWLARFGSAVAALLPLEEADQFEADVEGDPQMVTHLRYERSRRNRAAAIAIHGYDCRACQTNMEAVYGELGAGFIHVHHQNSLAEMGGAREVDPYTELVPLCPSCHSIIHRRRPPYSVDEVKVAVEARRVSAAMGSDVERQQGSSPGS